MSAVPGSPADYDIAVALPRNGVTPPGRDALGRWKDRAFEWLTRVFALLVFSILGAILVSLLAGSTLSLEKYGVAFLWREDWDPVREQFGALVPIYGTLLTSFIALAIGVPVSFGIALFLTELSPPWLKRPLGTAIELLAAIPSIIYGMWGLFVFTPLFQAHLQPWLIGTLGGVPGLGVLFEGPPLGIGMLTAGLILSIMVIPFITAVMRDVFELVPPMLKESAYALGGTTWEVVWRVVAQREGQFDIHIAAAGQTASKQVVVSPGLARVSPVRLRGNFWERVITSGEPALAENSPIQSIAITYPPRVINFAWMEWNWIVLFFVISLVAGFIFKSVLGIQV